MSFLFKNPKSEANRQQFEQISEEIRRVYARVGQPSRKDTPEPLLAELKTLARKVQLARNLEKRQRQVLLAFIYDTAGLLNLETNQWTAALKELNRARPIYEKLTDKTPLVGNLANIGRAWFMQGDNAKSQTWFERALAVAKAEGLGKTQAEILYQLGLLYRLNNDNVKALEQFQQGLLVASSINDPALRATFLTQVGQFYSDLGDWEKGRDYYERSLLMLEQAGNKAKLLPTLGQFNQLSRKQGDLDHAVKYARQGLELARSSGNSHEVVAFLHDLGMALLEKKQYQEALEYGQEALAIAAKMPGGLMQIQTLSLLTQSCLGLQNLAEARRWATQGLELAQVSSQKRELISFYSLLAEIEVADEHPRQAIEKLEKAGELFKELHDLETLAALYLKMGEMGLSQLHDPKLVERVTLKAYELSDNDDTQVAMYAFISAMQLIQALIEKSYYAQALNIGTICLDRARRDLKTALKRKKGNSRQNSYKLLFIQLLTILLATTQDLVNGKRDYYEKGQELINSLRSRFGDAFAMDDWTRSMYSRINS